MLTTCGLRGSIEPLLSLRALCCVQHRARVAVLSGRRCASAELQPCEVDTINPIGPQKRGVVNGQASLISELLFSAVGVGYFIYGKRQRATVPLVCGLVLMIFPYFVSSTV